MPEKTRVSKGLAAGAAALSAVAIAGIVTMTVLYEVQRAGLNMTARPTVPVTTEAPPPDLRLPRALQPERYDVFVQPHFYTRIVEEVNVTSPNQTALFTGNATVHLRALRDTSFIYLHSRDLNLSRAVVADEDAGRPLRVLRQTERAELGHRLEVQVAEPLREGGNYSLFLAFRGRMSDNLEGLFMAPYVEGTPEDEDAASAQRFVAITNMEGTGARSVFPCLDEPDLKAVFRLTVVHRRDTVALANTMAEDSTVIDEDWKFTRFQATPVMSTYLVAFSVSEFTKRTLKEPDGMLISVHARPEAIEKGHAQYALDVTRKVLRFFETQLEIDYPLRKLDQIALPDLGPAAMENWGLVTYQEGYLLFKEGVSSLMQKEDIAVTIAHELAHQWFGNLVTMKWWNDLWLKEGFAVYLSYFAVEHAEPTFKMKKVFEMEDLHAAFEVDALVSSRPLSPAAEDVQTYGQMGDMYDSITYCKGALVLRMLADYVGESTFHKGVRMFLKAFQRQSADQHDLWKYIQKASSDAGNSGTISELMDTWVNRNGFPVVTINTTSGEVSQKRFLYNHTAESSRVWKIPIRSMSDTTDFPLITLTTSGPTVKEEFLSEDDWILANVNCTGFYRVNYNPENWARLLDQLNTDPGRIPLMNRAQLIDDAFSLARAKLVDVTLALNLTRFLRYEREFLPWQSAMSNLLYMVHMFDRSEVYGPMQDYLRAQVEDLYNFHRNHTDNSTVPLDHFSQHSQIIAVRVACSFGLPDCIDMARDKYAQWMEANSTNNIHANLRSTVYCQAITVGGKEEWEFAWDQFLSSSDIAERNQLLEALACTRKTWLLNRLLGYTLDPDKIRQVEVPTTVENVAFNPAGQALAWNFVRANWDDIKHLQPSVVISEVTSRFSTPFEVQELERFAEDHSSTVPASAVEQAVEQARVNIQWVEENRDAVLLWFQQETEA